MEDKIAKLINELHQLPTIGFRTAKKIAFNIIEEDKNGLIKALKEIKVLKKCIQCNNIAQNELCLICNDKTRIKNQLCIVATVQDLETIEEKSFFNGYYFVLKHEINPRQGIGPEDIETDKIFQIINKETEVIIATNPTIEGELTAKYIKNIISEVGCLITRPSNGLPMGATIDYVDELTLARAFKERNKL